MYDGKPRRSLIIPSFSPLLKGVALNPLSLSHTFMLKPSKAHFIFSNNSCEFKLLPFIGIDWTSMFPFSFMGIIRDLNENETLIEPVIRDECMALWSNCYRNVRRLDRTINCKLVEISMFGNWESSLNSDSDSSGGSKSDSLFPYVFSWNKKIMTTFDLEPKNVKEDKSYYTNEDQIDSLW